MASAWLASEFDWDPHALIAHPVPPSGHLPASPSQGAHSPAAHQVSLPSAAATATDLSNGSATEQAPGTAGSPPPRIEPSGGGKGRRRRGAAAVCQVEGCGANIEGGKPFYRLQRICEMHARSLAVTDASGRALRFCQQCTRMHSVSDFEGAKRSCVASLKRRAERKQAQQAERREEAAVDPTAGKGARRKGGRGLAAGDAAAPGAATLSGSSGGGGGGSSDSRTTSGAAPPRSQHSGGSGSGGGFPDGGSLNQPQQPQPPLQQHQQHQQLLSPPPASLAAFSPGAAGPQLPAETSPAASLSALRLQQGAAAAQPWQGHLPAVGAAPPAPQLVALPPPQQLGLGLGLQQVQAQQGPGQQASLNALLTQHNLLAPGNYHHLPAAHELQAQQLLVPGAGLPPQPVAAQPQHQQHFAPAPAPAPGPRFFAPAAPAGGQPGGAMLAPARTHDMVMCEAPSMPTLSPAELDMLLTMDPDDMASALLARTDAASCSQAAGPLPAGMPPVSLPATSSGAAYGGQGAFGAMPSGPHARGGPHGQPGLAPQLAAWPAAGEAADMLHAAAAPQLAQLPAAAGMPGDFAVVRISFKMYGLHPDQLPPQLRQELQHALLAAPTVLSGAVRAGCSHLTVNLLATSAEAAALQQPSGPAAALARLLHGWQQQQQQQQGQGGEPQGRTWRLPAGLPLLRVVAQVESGGGAVLLAPVAEGRLVPGAAVLCAVGPSSSSALHQRLELSLSPATPAATTVGQAGGRFQLRCADWQELALGAEPVAARRMLHCRSRGRHATVALLRPGGGAAAAERVAARTNGRVADVDEAGAAAEAEQQEEDSEEEPEEEFESEGEEEEEEVQQLLLQQGAAEAWVPAAQRQWGLYELELASGPFLGGSVPVLVLPDELAGAAAELQQLQHGEQAGRVLRLVSMVLEHEERQREAAEAAARGPAAAAAARAALAAAYPPAALERLAGAARALCALCVRCRWPALLRRMLPAAAAASDAAAAVAAMDAMLPPVGLLGTAAAAGQAATLWALADHAVALGHSWQLACSSSGLTPLHLAAALGRGLSGDAASALVAALGPAAAAGCWRGARAGGWTPRQVATAAGCAALLDLLSAGEEAAGEAAGAGSSGGDALKPWKQKQQQQLAEEEQQLLQQRLEGEPGKKAAAGSAAARRASERAAGRLTLTAAELHACRQRPLHPAVLLGVVGGAVCIVFGLAAALRLGLYDD